MPSTADTEAKRTVSSNVIGKNDERELRPTEAQSVGEPVNRERRVGVQSAVSRLARLSRGGDELLRPLELRQEAVDAGEIVARAQPSSPATECSGMGCIASGPASGTSVRISKIEIIGRNRMKRKRSARNSPIVPAKVAQSQIVGKYIPHEEGMKSRCRLVTTMTNLSSHIPIDTTTAIPKSRGGLDRTRLTQRNCGATMLQSISA